MDDRDELNEEAAERITRSFIDRATTAYENAADFDSVYDEADIEPYGWAPETMAAFATDVRCFVLENASDIEHLSPELVGTDFWLTRNRHGAGFWDRDLGAVGERLTDAAHAYGPCELYVGDDHLIYC